MSYEVEPPYLIVRVCGELDVSNRAALQGTSHLHRPDLSTVLLDLHDLTFCDGSGIRALLEFRQQHIQRGRFFWVTRIHPQVRRVMDICKVSDTFVQ